MKIFISHRKLDNNFVHKLTALLRKYKIDYWVDTEQLYNRISYINKEIQKGLHGSSHFLLIWSANAKESKWVKQEVAKISHRRKIKPFSFRLDGTPLEGFSKRFSYFDYLHVTLEDLEEKVRDFLFMKIANDTEFISQVRLLKDKIRHDFEHFGKYSKNDEELSVKSFRKYDTFNQFVSQQYIDRKTNTKEKNILGFLTDLLSSDGTNSQKFGIVEGGYGSGKSLLSLFMLYNLCRNVTNDKLIPLYVPLGKLENYDHDVSETLVDSIFQFVKREYKIAHRESFYQYMDAGKIIFILDGLDELSSGFYSNIIDTNIKNITRLIGRDNTVLLTARNTYLTEEQESNLINQTQLMEISDFDEHLMNKFIGKKFAGHKLNFDKASFLRTLQKPEIREYTGKPLFLEIICNRYNDIIGSPVVNPASILKILTDEWIRHDVYKKDIDIDSKRELIKIRQRISESLALLINRKGFTSPISSKEIEEQIDEEFALEKSTQYTQNDLVGFCKDAKNATFLMKETNQTVGEGFSFIYRTVAEYLVARRIITYINQNSDGSKTDSILRYLEEISTPETFQFMEYITDIEWAIRPHVFRELFSNQPQEFILTVSGIMNRTDEVLKLIETVKIASTNANPKDNPPIGNLVTLLYLVSDFGKFNFRNLTRNIKKIDFSNCNLEGVRLSHADLTGSIFMNANLYNADLSNANLTRANLSNATLYYTNLTGADLTGADLTTSKMIETKLIKADLTGADLTGCDTTMGNDYAWYDGMYHANLSNANLFDADLSGADLVNSIIINPISFDQLKGDKKTDLSRSITTSTVFIDHVSQFTNKGPKLITSIDDLRNWIDSIDDVFDKNLMEALSKICNFGS